MGARPAGRTRAVSTMEPRWQHVPGPEPQHKPQRGQLNGYKPGPTPLAGRSPVGRSTATRRAKASPTASRRPTPTARTKAGARTAPRPWVRIRRGTKE